MKKNYKTTRNSNFILLVLGIALLSISNICAQCTNGTLYPTATFTPANNATTQVINTDAYAGEYCNVNLQAGKSYRFTSSTTTDFITLTTSSGNVIGSGLSGVVYQSPTSQVIRYYIHLSASCTTSQIERTRFINISSCNSLTSLSTSNITSNSFQVNSVGTASSSNCYLVTDVPNFTPSTTQVFGVQFQATNSVLINNYYPGFGDTNNYLEPATTYYVWVGVQCTNGSIDWLPKFTCTTLASFTTAGCNAAIYGCYPEAIFTPAYTGQPEIIAQDSYAGEFCRVNIIPSTSYTFSTSAVSDYITITNNAGNILLGGSFSPFVFNSGANSGPIRYYLTTGPYNCDGEATNRIRYVKGPQLQSCQAPTNLVSTMTTFETANVTWNSTIVPGNGFDYILSPTFITPNANSTPTGNVSNTNVVLTNLFNNQYYFYVRANCGTFKSNWVNITLSTTFVPTPSNLTAANITSNGVRLKYTLLGIDVSTTAIPVKFYVSTSPTPPTAATTPTLFASYGTLGTDGLLYNQIGSLNSNTTYYFWMKAFWNGTDSALLSGGTFTTNGFFNCNSSDFGVLPEATYTPLCNNSTSSILTNTNFLATYSNVNITPNTTYTFSSSSPSDFVTITNDLGNSVLASGLSSIVWSSGNFSGVVRYFIHGNSSCGNSTDSSSRTKFIKCQSSLSNEDFEDVAFSLYPNPIQNILTISHKSVINAVSLFNVLGQEVLTKAINSEEGILDVSSLPSGTYLVKIAVDNLVKTLKVLKQ